MSKSDQCNTFKTIYPSSKDIPNFTCPTVPHRSKISTSCKNEEKDPKKEPSFLVQKKKILLISHVQQFLTKSRNGENDYEKESQKFQIMRNETS